MFLFQLYSRARVSDIRNIDGVVVDITVVTDISRRGPMITNRNAFQMHRPRVAFGCTHTVPYRACAVNPGDLRSLMQQLQQVLNSKRDTKVLCFQQSAGNWVQRAVTSGETGDWLIKVLRTLLSAAAPGISSHSLKCTTLSWMAKAGFSEPTRMILGHHSMKQEIFGELLA